MTGDEAPRTMGKRKLPPFLARKFSSRETRLGTGKRQVLQHFRARALTSINAFYGTGLYLEICDTRENWLCVEKKFSLKATTNVN